MSQRQVTICSMYHSDDSSELLSLNFQLTRKKNPRISITWLVADNRPRNSLVKVPEGQFTFVPGLHIEDLQTVYLTPIVYAFHGGLALNTLLPHCNTDYVIFLDSDFFIVQENWIEEVIDDMESNYTAVFGASWHPKHFNKRRYFPTHAFSVFNTKLVPVRELDFLPDHMFKDVHKATSSATSFPQQKKAKKGQGLLYRVWWNFRARLDIGVSRDVTHRIARMIEGSGLRIENIPAVWKTERLPSRLTRFVDFFLPERFSYMPKRADYFVTLGFKEAGLPDFDAQGMEEYVWRSKPFAVHVRNTWKREDVPRVLSFLRESLL